MSYINNDSLVDAAWVAAHRNAAQVKIVDASWHLPPTGRDGHAEYRDAHIPGAVYFDIDAIADKSSTLPHMLPSAATFAAAVGAMGIGNDDRVVVYDAEGLFSAPRVWWMFRVFGHDNVAVLSGGLRAWRAAGQPVDSAVPAPAPAQFTAALRPQMVRSLAQLQDNLASGAELVVDARAAGRFAGSEPEFRPGVRPGHIPGAVNLPYGDIVDAATGSFVGAAELQNAFDALGIDGAPGGKPVTTSCGSGVTACILGLGLHLVGRDNWAVYDGSWTEWGGHSETPVEPA